MAGRLAFAPGSAAEQQPRCGSWSPSMLTGPERLEWIDGVINAFGSPEVDELLARLNDTVANHVSAAARPHGRDRRGHCGLLSLRRGTSTASRRDRSSSTRQMPRDAASARGRLVVTHLSPRVCAGPSREGWFPPLCCRSSTELRSIDGPRLDETDPVNERGFLPR